MAYAPYSNPAAEALQNQQMINGLFTAPMENYQKQQQAMLQFAFSQKQAQLESQLAMQRQLSQQQFEDIQSTKAQKAAAETAAAAQTGETFRTGVRAATEKDIETARAKSAADIEAASEKSAGERNLADIKARAAENRIAQNMSQAQAIRADPRAARIIGSDTLSKLDLTKPEDAATVVRLWNEKATPQKLENVDATDISTVSDQRKALQQKIMAYPDSDAGKVAYTRALLADQNVQNLLFSHTAMAGSITPAQAQAIVQNPMAPIGPDGKTGADFLTQQLNRKTLYFGTIGDDSNTMAVAQAQLKARGTLLDPNSPYNPPMLATLLGQSQALGQQMASIYQHGNIRTPEGYKTAFGDTQPLTTQLAAQGAGTSSMGTAGTNYNTPLGPGDAAAFQAWKQKYAPNDSGQDYDLQGAFKAGLTPGANGHWDDRFKKPNHPTFSTFSQYAPSAPNQAGTWNGSTYVPNPASNAQGIISPSTPPGPTPSQGFFYQGPNANTPLSALRGVYNAIAPPAVPQGMVRDPNMPWRFYPDPNAAPPVGPAQPQYGLPSPIVNPMPSPVQAMNPMPNPYAAPVSMQGGGMSMLNPQQIAAMQQMGMMGGMGQVPAAGVPPWLPQPAGYAPQSSIY